MRGPSEKGGNESCQTMASHAERVLAGGNELLLLVQVRASCSCRVAFGARAQPGALQRKRRKLRVDACLVFAIKVVEALGIAAEELHVRDHVARVGLLFALL